MDKMENEEIEFETYNDEEEQSISVSGGMEYTPLKVEDLPRSEKEDKVIQKKIYSGEDFYEEKEHLRIVINCINKKIKSIESKSSYTGKYAVCRGGDDGTMQLQLRSNKESSEHDRLIVNELKDG